MALFTGVFVDFTQLNPQEEHVIQVIIDVEYTNRMNIAAAGVIEAAWSRWVKQYHEYLPALKGWWDSVSNEFLDKPTRPPQVSFYILI